MKDRTSIPVTSEGPSGLCGGCNGACCQKGMILTLTDRELRFMQNGGVQLVDAGLPSRDDELARLSALLGNMASRAKLVTTASENRGYLLVKDCANLTDLGGSAVCSVYDDPERPVVCGNLSPDSPRCHEIRDNFYFQANPNHASDGSSSNIL